MINKEINKKKKLMRQSNIKSIFLKSKRKVKKKIVKKYINKNLKLKDSIKFLVNIKMTNNLMI